MDVTDCTRTLHVINQYLAAVGINYAEKQADDRHTNMAWNESTSSFVSREIPTRANMVFNLPDFTLEWVGKRSDRFSLNRRTHENVISWISEKAIERGLPPFRFDLHYELGSGPITDDRIHEMPDRGELRAHALLRTISQQAITAVLKVKGRDAEIRVWPHHFDTGAFFTIDGGVGIGLGMAIPDPVVDDYYLYVSGYRGDKQLSTDEHRKLCIGNWRSEEFTGATVPMSGLDVRSSTEFLMEAIDAFIDQS
jgi:hypothetical protein